MKRLLVVLGGGGHTWEMLRLVDKLGSGFRYFYLIAHNDHLSRSKIRLEGRVYSVKLPSYKSQSFLSKIVSTLISSFESIIVLMRLNPDVVISVGPGVAVPISILAKLARKRVIFIESISRVTTRSISGRILCRFSDLFFVQWPELKKRYPKAIYAGRLA